MARANRITHNGGRPQGANGKRPQRRRQIALANVERLSKRGVTPLDVMLAVMHKGIGPLSEGKSGYESDQYQAAVDAAPYIHPKLAAVAFKPMPDAGQEKRHSLLKALPYDKRREIAAILEAHIRQQASGPATDGDGVEGGHMRD
jgi:hypothetical protein